MEDLAQLRIGIRIDGSDMERSLKAIKKDLKLATDAFKASSQGPDRFASRLEYLQNQMQGLEGVLNNQKEYAKRLQLEYNRLTQTMDQNSNKVRELKTEYQRVAREQGEDSEAAKRLKAEYQALERTMETNGTEMHRLQQEYVRVNGQMNRTEGQIARVTREIQAQPRAVVNLSESFRRLGDRMKSIGRDMTMYVTTPIVAGMGLAVKSFMDFDQGMKDIQAVSGATADEMKSLEGLIIQQGKDTQYSATEAAKGVEELIKAGLTTTQVLNGGLSGALTLAAAGGLELGDAAEIASTALNAFRKDNLSVAKAADILAGAANVSATDVGELKFGLSMVSAVASGVGLSFTDTAAALAAFAQNGLKGSDAGTSLKTMLLNLSPTTKAATDMMDSLGLGSTNAGLAFKWLSDKGIKPMSKDVGDVSDSLMQLAKRQAGAGASAGKVQKEFDKLAKQSGFASSAFYDQNGHLKSMEDIAGILQNKLSGLSDEQRQYALKVMFGTDAIRAANILYKEGAAGISKMSKAMLSIKAADVAATKMDSLKGAIERMKGSVETMGIEFGRALAPLILKVAGAIDKLADKFSNLSPAAKQTILVIGGVAAAVGPLLLILGSLSIAIAAISAPVLITVGVIAALAAGAVLLYNNWDKFMKQSGAIKTALVIAFAPLFAIVAPIKLVQKAMSDSIPAVDRYGKGVSEGTQKALDAYFKLSDGASKKLKELELTNEEVTVNTKNKLVETYGEMTDEILAKIEERKQKEKQKLQEMLMNNATMTQDEKDNILLKESTYYKSLEQMQKDSNKRIGDILTQATKEKRGLTDNERSEINNIQQAMNKNAVEYMSKSEIEQKTIMARMKATAGDLSVQQAASIVANSNKAKDGAVKAANDQYDQTIESIIRMRDESHVITADQADRMIKDATRQRDETVKRAEDAHQGVVKAAKAQSGEHIKEVNWQTGQVLSKWEVYKNSVVEKFNGMKKGFTSAISGMISAGAIIWGQLKEAVTKKAQEIITAVEKKFNAVKDAFKNGWDKAVKFFNSIDLSDIGRDIVRGIIRGIDHTMDELKKKIQGMADKLPKWLKDKLGIKSPSRVLASQVGVHIPTGIAMGMEKSLPQLQSMTEKMAAATIPALNAVVPQSGVRGMGPTTNNTTNFNPSITVNSNDPFRTALENQRMLRRLAFQGGISR
jgi:TP901 family phage tail tape measure protein